jgi:predicted nucleotide-binding protein
MARRPNQPPPQSPVLTPEQIRRRIESLRRCIGELQQFDPQKVQKRYNITEVVALETSITDALGAAFGHGTARFNLYKDAANLDQGPHTVRLAPAFGRGPTPNYDSQEAHEARQYLAEGKLRSIQLLERAIRTLEDEIADRGPESYAPIPPPAAALVPLGQKIFIVHGHAGESREAVARFLERLGLEPVILHERPNEGKTVIEKFEAHADVGFAIILLTSDDVGGPAGGEQRPRARQNVILELGYFIGRLTRSKVCAFKADDVELPSDILGIAWTTFDQGGAWQIGLAKELQAAGYKIDWNKVMAP